jgi:Fic family protein
MTNHSLTWLNATLRATDEIDWLELAAEMMLRLIEAHPFKDGNGRVSRAIATWLLTQGGYNLISNPRVYCRMYADRYYKTLTEAMQAEGTEGSRAETDGHQSWNRFFRDMVQACFEEPGNDPASTPGEGMAAR